MKLAVAAAVAVGALVLPAANAAPQERALGIDTTVLGMRLAWYDPATLTRLPGRTVPLASHAGAWSRSPDGTKLAIGGAYAADDLRFVDLKRMRVLGTVKLGLRYRAGSVAWLRPNRVLAAGGTFAAAVDPAHLRVVRRTRLPGIVEEAAVLPDGLALLLRQDVNGFVPAKIVVVDVEGHVRTATLDRVAIGYRSSGDKFEIRSAGFAVDAATRRAFVVGTDDTIAAVDLRSLAFSYHGGSQRSLAKPMPGPRRVARWLGGGLLAVSGADEFRGAGLRIVDTRDWSTRVVDGDYSEDLSVGGGVIVGLYWTDFAVYGLDGSLRYRMELGNGEELDVAGQYGYVCHGSALSRVIELATGAILRDNRMHTAQTPVCVTLLVQ